MTAPSRVCVEWAIPLTEPREFTHKPTGEMCVGVYVKWEALVLPGDWHGVTSVMLFAADFKSAEIAFHVSPGDEVPDWVPRPPDGWDAAVVALRAEHFPERDA